MATPAFQDRPLTKPQVKMLTTAMRNDCAFATRQKWRTAWILVEQGLATVLENEVRITRLGLRALHDYRMRIWGKHGSMASLDDFEEVKAALAHCEPEAA